MQHNTKLTQLPPTPWRDAGVVDTGNSPHAVLRPVPIRAVTMGPGFWRPRMDANRRAGIPAFHAWLDRDDQTAPFPAFARHGAAIDHPEIRTALERMDDTFMGRNRHRLRHTWRAAVLKLVEACAFVLQSGEDPTIRARFDPLVAGIVAAHGNRDFLKAYYGPDFENSYQLATPGHLIQAAIAHHRCTGRDEFLSGAARVADAVDRKLSNRTCADHPCIEMALVELYRATGSPSHLRTARRLLSALLEQPDAIGQGRGAYHEDGHDHFGRHVVRQPYLCAGGADYLAETGDAEFRTKLEALWRDMVMGKLHITGQLAVDYWMPERITAEPFELSTGVFGVLQDHVVRGCELCEAVGNAYWNWRMLACTADAKYMDSFERTLYNGFLAHVSLDGAAFHYLSPLATDGDFPPRNAWGSPEANCCPPNALRFIASVPGYIFSTSSDGLWVHLYDDCRLDWRLADGTGVALVQHTRYPWAGTVTIEVHPAQPAEFALNLRIPGWSRQAAVRVNGQDAGAVPAAGSYCRLDRRWEQGDVVTLELPMPIVAMGADPRARDFEGKAALMRGPLVYCFEGVDHPGLDVWDIRLPGMTGVPEACQDSLYTPIGAPAAFEVVSADDVLGGVPVVRGPSGIGAGTVTAVPYHAWANRGAAPMRVWVDRAP